MWEAVIGVMVPGITVHGITRGIVLTGIIHIVGAGAAITVGAVIIADGIRPGTTIGTGHPMAGAGVITADITEATMADIGVIPITITGLTIAISTDVLRICVQAIAMQVVSGHPVLARHLRNEPLLRSIAGVRQ